MVDVRQLMRRIYDNAVEKRDKMALRDWEVASRDKFLSALANSEVRSVLEIGAATGRDAELFVDAGFEVVCTDLSQNMVDRCRERGLDARVMDASELQFEPESFDAVYAKNCLLHIPNAELDATLAGIAAVIKRGGWLYAAVYGGTEFEGVWADDAWDDKRFFSFRTDEFLRKLFGRHFEIESFDTTDECWNGQHYQAVIARRR